MGLQSEPEQFDMSEHFVAVAGLYNFNVSNILNIRLNIHVYNLSIKIYSFHVVAHFVADGEEVLLLVA